MRQEPVIELPDRELKEWEQEAAFLRSRGIGRREIAERLDVCLMSVTLLFSEKARQSHKKNREKMRDRDKITRKAWEARNREKIRGDRRLWKKLNYEKVQAEAKVRYARKKELSK